ncbi:MAG: extracellular solute-binding protein [Candidatus Atribacteria bacterium]|nr:extracellular solute-binding protein [Candidatus Atribacteria bacterium]MCD6349653.1 extracellular solute-binding protein [Candidatus Atribacteria bacterium]
MKKLAIYLVFAMCALVILSLPVMAKVEISGLFMKQAGYQESDIRAMTDEFLKQNPDIAVNLSFVAYEELHDKIVVAAASGAGTYDVILLDCIWPAEFAEAGWLLDVTDRLSEEDRADIFPEVLSSVTYKGRLYGMPWLNDWEYFFYNKKMLEDVGATPPAYWPEVIEISKKLKDAGIVKYPIIDAWGQGEAVVIQWLQYAMAMGGELFDESGNPIMNQGAPLKALEFMVDNMKAGYFNPACVESFYEEVRRVFSAGQAAFGLNWTYMYNLANDPQESQIAGNAVLALIPGFPEGRRSATCNGGMGLSIMKTSKHPDEAWKYVTYLASKEVQKKHSQNALPIWKSLYDDPELIAQQPEVVKVAKEQIRYVFDRPQVPWYSQFSLIMSEELQAALTGAKTPQRAMDDAVSRVKEVMERY